MPRFTVIECQGIGPLFCNDAVTVTATVPRAAVGKVTNAKSPLAVRAWGDPAAKTWLVTNAAENICCFVVEHT